MTNLEFDLDELMERVVARAYAAGFAAAGRTVEPPMDCEAAYRDWRGYGPGALLPGGDRASESIRSHDAALASAQGAPLITREQFYNVLKKGTP